MEIYRSKHYSNSPCYRSALNKITKQVSTDQDSQSKKRNNQRGIGRNAVDAVGGDNEKQQTQEQTEDKTVTAGQIRGLVATEVRDRNPGDIATSYSGDSSESIRHHYNLY